MVYWDGSTLVTVTMEPNTPETCSAAGGTAGKADSPKPFELSSYSHLLHSPRVRPAGRSAKVPDSAGSAAAVNGIVVPTIRSAERLRSAVDLAAGLRCQLVVLCTDKFPDRLSSVLAKLQPGMATVVALSSDDGQRRLDLGPGVPQSLVSGCALDISRKRNLGLLIGRACKWTSMLFLDDDIRRINAEKLSSAAALLAGYPVVGLQVKKYPDASVVGHARRLTGHYNEPFISGGSLLVDPQRLHGFFPAVYHEDWLCLINNLRLGEVAIGGSVGQLPYRPFTTPERAKIEEFGDILASGMLWMVHAASKTRAGQPFGQDGVRAATAREYWHAATERRFWESILVQRFILLGNIIERLKLKSALDTDAARLESVIASYERCGQLSSREFVTFVDSWLDGLGAWQARMATIPPADSVHQALTALGFQHAVSPYAPDHQGTRAATAGRRKPACVPSAGQATALNAFTEVARTVVEQPRRWRERLSRSGYSASHDRASRLGGVEHGRGAGRRAQRPLAGGDQAKHEDHPAHGGQ